MSQTHKFRSSIVDVHFLVECSAEPHLAQLCRTMTKMLMTCVGAAAVEHASANAVEPNEASRRRAARLRLFRARTPRAVSLDGVRNVSWPSRAAAASSKRPSSSEGVRGLSQLGRVVVYEVEKPQGRQKSFDGVRAVS